MVKNIIIVVLVIVIVVMGYMLMVSFPDKAKTECEAAVTSTVQQCMTGAQQCQQTLQQLMQVPACASALTQ